MKLLSVVALAFAFAIVSLPCAEARPENNPEKDDAQDPHQGDHGEPPVTTVASPTTVASNASEPVPTDPPADVVDPAKGVNPDSDGGVNTTLAPSEDTSSNAAPSSSEMGETTTTSEPVTKAPESLDSTIPPEDNTAEKTTEKVATTPAASTASPDPHDFLKVGKFEDVPAIYALDFLRLFRLYLEGEIELYELEELYKQELLKRHIFEKYGPPTPDPYEMMCWPFGPIRGCSISLELDAMLMANR